MSKAKNFLKFLLNPRLYILLYLAVSSVALIFFGVKYTKKLTIFLALKQEIKVGSSKKIKQKINLSERDYFSAGYSINTNDKEKTITTAGIICILPNGNILHVVMTGESVDNKIKNTEDTIGFLTKHQDEIFDDIARTIVEAGQKQPLLEPKNEINATIKKKV